ncbi:hypothetical protein [Niveispirillum irakense]|uniref:hypothetical protein n=1 Tax=Niveispirillum irakense TaxID=34011 RepID=UPI0003FFA562|nr:hypothetical protein [Niveispirillum irakense]
MFNTPYIVPVLALAIPSIAIVLNHIRKWQAIDLEQAQGEVDLRRRFRSMDEIDRRVADIERYVTSPEFELNRKFRHLADKP